MTPLLQQWLLDHGMLTNRVHHAEATELLGLIPDNSIDLIVTSPPYDNLRKYNGYSFPFERIAHESYRVLKQGGVLVWVVGDATVDGSETLTSFRQALYFTDTVKFRMHDTMIYEKDAPPGVPGKRYEQSFEFMFVVSKGEPKTFNPQHVRSKNAGERKRREHRAGKGHDYDNGYRVVKDTRLMPNVWYVQAGYMKSTKDVFAYDHPAMFPEELAERHILSWSNEGDIVLDYFGGSGTTAKMARNNGRRWITGDISGEYVELMRKRLAQPYTLPMWAA